MIDRNEKSLIWLGSSQKQLKKFPAEVKQSIAYALFLAQSGDKHREAKPLKGFSGASVLEMVEDFDGDTYRGVYTVKFSEVVYVLHAFKKKSKSGVATPPVDIKLIKSRLKMAEEHYHATYALSKKGGR